MGLLANILGKRSVRARYDAAQTTAENRNHWRAADAKDAVAANVLGVRAILRKRSRYEVANNSYAKGIVGTLANDVVGTGPRLQMLFENRTLNQAIERKFRAWASQTRLARKLRTMVKARVTDGEAFALLFSNPVLRGVTLDLRLIEADQVDTPWLGEKRYTDGVHFDAHGNVVSYAMLSEHPGGLRAGSGYRDVSAADMLHWFLDDRPGQVRGIPEITPSLHLFGQLRRYTLAVLGAAETAANNGAYIKTNLPPDAEAADVPPTTEIEWPRNTAVFVPEGWEPYQLKAEQPTTTYGMFKQEVINEMTRCLLMPYLIAASDASGHNYSSGRLDIQGYFKAIGVLQADLALVALDCILAAWYREARLRYGWPAAPEDEDLPHTWFFDGHEHVDPSKEATAQKTRLDNNTTTLATEYARQGRDWETELRQRAREVALVRELGLSSAQAAPTADDDEKKPEDDTEDEETDDDEPQEQP